MCDDFFDVSFHATQYPLKKSDVSVTKTKKDKNNNIALINFGRLLTPMAAAKKEGNKIITYLGTEEKLPWTEGIKNPSIA